MSSEDTYVLGNAWIPARFWKRVTTNDPMAIQRLLRERYIKEKDDGERKLYIDRG